MHEFTPPDDRGALEEPTVTAGFSDGTPDTGYDAVACDQSEHTEPDIDDGLPPDVPETANGPNEWLPKIGMDTPLLDVLTRPSVFNPRPDLAAGGMEVLDIMEPTGNPRITVKYTESNTATGAILPFSEVAPPTVAEDGDATAELISTEEMDRHIVEAGIPDANWIPMDRYWAHLSADLAHTHILQEDGAAAVEEVKALAVANAANLDDPYDTGYGKHVSTRPKEFVQGGIAAAQAAIENGNPSRGYALASETFRGFSYPIGNKTEISNDAFFWTTDKEGMSSHLFPTFAEPWSTLPQGQVTGFADPFYIGKNATELVKGKLMGEAVEGWLRTNSDTAAPAAVEKAWHLRERINNRTQVAETELRERLEAARQQYRGDAWQVPDNLTDYVFDRLKA